MNGPVADVTTGAVFEVAPLSAPLKLQSVVQPFNHQPKGN